MKTRNIREVKVGDIVQSEVGDRYKVIELHKDTFACLDCDDELRPRWVYWMAFDEANEADWFIENKEVTKVFDGVDDSEEVEFTKEELFTLFYGFKEIGERQRYGTVEDKDCKTILSKLNKMLKEKE